MAKYQVAKHGLGGWRLWFVGLWFAACGETATVESGSETHFLLRCIESCGAGFECLGGVCTRDCETDTDCSDLSAAAVCAEAGQGCRVFCDADRDCSDENEAWLCQEQQCISKAPAVDTPECPLFSGGLQEPSVRTTRYTDVPTSENTVQAVADDDGLFWRNDSGAVRGLVDSELIELRPAVDDLRAALGMLTDDTTLYFADAGPPWAGPPEEPADPPPPGRLYSVPKTGGEVELLLELDDAILTPLAVTERGVVIRSGEHVYVVEEEGVELLEHIPPLPPYQLQIADGRAYWSDWSSVRQPTELFAVDLEGGDPEVVTEIDGTFMVGNGRVFWKSETMLTGPLVLLEKLFMFDLETGCITELPHRGESIGAPALDAVHVYWTSFNGLGNSGDDACVTPLPLLRVNLTSGVLEELQVEGFSATICTDFMAHDGDTLFMRTWQDHSLVAIDKP